MKQEEVIEEAIAYVTSKGIKIIPGALFDWTKPGPDYIPVKSETPTSCNAYGAVLLHKNQEHTKSPWKSLAEILDVDSSWLYRFKIGFDVGNEIQIIQESKKDTKLREDKVNTLGLTLRRRYVNWKD